MLSSDEARQFLELHLGISNSFSNLIEDPVNLLQKIVKHFHLKFPFQSLTLLSKQDSCYSVPTVDQIKSDIFNGFGGLCLTNNYFICELLLTVGFDTIPIAGTCSPKHPNNHIASVVSINGVNYLVDVGFGYPTMQPVPLNFQDISPTYKDGFLSYRFKKRDVNLIEREHLLNFPTTSTSYKAVNPSICEWQGVYTLDLTPRTYDFFYEPMKEVYTDRFLKKFRLILFQEDGIVAYREENMQIVRLDLKEENFASVVFYDDDHLCKDIQEHWTKASKSMIQTALQCMRKFYHD